MAKIFEEMEENIKLLKIDIKELCKGNKRLNEENHNLENQVAVLKLNLNRLNYKGLKC